MAVTAMLVAPSFIAASPIVLQAQSKSREALYDACMDKAEATLLKCLEAAGDTKPLCWSRFGYSKLGCTVSYFIRSIF